MEGRVRSGNLYMNIRTSPNRVTATYTEGRIRQVEAISLENGSCQIEIKTADAQTWQWNSDLIYFTAFLMYGIAVSKDGKYLFAQQYTNGLICLDIQSGARVWKTRSKAEISHILVGERTLCCAKSRNAIQLIDIDTGEVRAERRTPYDNRFDVLSENTIFNHSRAGVWEVISVETLEVLESIPQKALEKDYDRLILKRLYANWNPETND